MPKDDEKEKKEQKRKVRDKRVPRNMAHINKDPSTCSLLNWGTRNWISEATESTGSSLGDQPEINFPVDPYVVFANQGSTSTTASSSLKNAAAATPSDQGTHSPSGYVQGPVFSSSAALNRDSPDHGANLLRDEVGLPQSHFNAPGNHLIVDSSTLRPSSSYPNHLSPVDYGGNSTTASSPRRLANTTITVHPREWSPNTTVHIDSQAPTSLFAEATSCYPGVSSQYPSSSPFEQQHPPEFTESIGANNLPVNYILQRHLSIESSPSASTVLLQATSTGSMERFNLCTTQAGFRIESHSSLPDHNPHWAASSFQQQHHQGSTEGHYNWEGRTFDLSPASAGLTPASSTAFAEQFNPIMAHTTSFGPESHSYLPNHNLQITSSPSVAEGNPMNHLHNSIMGETSVMGGGSNESDVTWAYSSLLSSGSAQTTQPDHPFNLYDEGSLHDGRRFSGERSASGQYSIQSQTPPGSLSLVDRRHSERTPRQNHPYRPTEKRAHRTVAVNPRMEEHPSFGSYVHTPPATNISASVLSRGGNYTHEAPQRPQRQSRSFEEHIISSSSPSISTTSSQSAPQKTLASGSNTHQTRYQPRNSTAQPDNHRVRSRSGVAATHRNGSPVSRTPHPYMFPLAIPDQGYQYPDHGRGSAAAGPSIDYHHETPRVYSSGAQPVVLTKPYDEQPTASWSLPST